jgi:crotonobetainyl-CoA:carnitine CoA-transferase CaiB-like acyl-CoA transferase
MRRTRNGALASPAAGAGLKSARDPGEHTDAVPQELGYDRASIDELRREGAIA